jgi:hypothetical protein
MFKRYVMTAAVAASPIILSATHATAQGFTGGDLGIKLFVLSEDSDIGHTRYFGSGEFAITPSFAIAGDFASYRSNAISTNATVFMLHGIYHFDRTTSFGLFLGQERADEGNYDTYGVEAATNFMGATLEGFVGQSRADDVATFVGAAAEYPLMNQITLTGDVGFVGLDGDNFTRLSAGAEYALAVGPTLYAEAGLLGTDVDGSSDSATFIGIGARLDFGPNGGTTFGRRGLFEIVPGR